MRYDRLSSTVIGFEHVQSNSILMIVNDTFSYRLTTRVIVDDSSLVSCFLHHLIVVGIIPGPKEPKLHINSFLQPLVDDLIDLWDGIILNASVGGPREMFRASLLALSSDIPATRKCGGFVGHTAKKGKALHCCLISL